MKLFIKRALSLFGAAIVILPAAAQGHALALCTAVSCSLDSTTIFGQQQAYDVLLRGNGDAVVNARVTFGNNDTESLTKINYSVVSGTLSSVEAFQEVTCNSLPVLSSGASAPDQKSSAAMPTNTVPTTDVPECYPGLKEHPLSSTTVPGTAAQAPLPYYYPSGSTYKKITVNKNNNNFILNLPVAVKKSDTTTVVMLYNLSGISTKQRGAMHYAFKTLKSSDRVNDTIVSISTDENYILADAAKSKVNYKPTTSSSALNSNLKAGTAQGSSADVSTYVSTIGTNGNITKHASSLAPEETFTVSGRFATSSFILNWPRTVSRWAFLILIIGLLVYWYLRRRKRLSAQADTKSEDVSEDVEPAKEPEMQKSKAKTAPELPTAYYSTTTSSSIRALPFYGVIMAFRKKIYERSVRPMFIGWLFGLMAVILIGVVLWAGVAITNANNNNYYAGNGTLYMAVTIGLFIVGFLGFLFICIGLPILYAGNFRRAMRIFLHILLFFVTIGIILTAVFVRYAGEPRNYPNDQLCSGLDTYPSQCIVD